MYANGCCLAGKMDENGVLKWMVAQLIRVNWYAFLAESTTAKLHVTEAKGLDFSDVVNVISTRESLDMVYFPFTMTFAL